MSNLPSDLIIDNGDGDKPMSNQSANQNFETVLNARLSRRAVLKGGLGTAISALFGGAGVFGAVGVVGLNGLAQRARS